MRSYKAVVVAQAVEQWLSVREGRVRILAFFIQMSSISSRWGSGIFLINKVSFYQSRWLPSSFPFSITNNISPLSSVAQKMWKINPKRGREWPVLNFFFFKDELLGLPFSGTSKSNGLKRESISGESINCCVQRGKKVLPTDNKTGPIIP